MNKPYIIAIAAISGGGKTTITKLLNKELTNSAVFHFDDYDFEGPSNLVEWTRQGSDYNQWNLDLLISDLESAISSAQYDYILLDYPFSYLNKKTNNFIDVSIYIDTPLDIAIARWILRDYNKENIEGVFIEMESYLLGAREAYLAMVNKVKPNSDIVIDGSIKKEEIIKEIKQYLKVTH